MIDESLSVHAGDYSACLTFRQEGAPNIFSRKLFGMPKPLLSERLVKVREAVGYGGRRAAAFARLLGIKPASLHDLESGKTKALGGKSLAGYIRAGANPTYIERGIGPPLLADVSRYMRQSEPIAPQQTSDATSKPDVQLALTVNGMELTTDALEVARMYMALSKRDKDEIRQRLESVYLERAAPLIPDERVARALGPVANPKVLPQKRP
jgi:hypothetical protein